MVSTRKKMQQSRRLPSQLCDYDQDVINGDTAKSGQRDVIVSHGTDDWEFFVKFSGKNSTINEKTVNVQTMKRCFNEKIDREMGNIVDTVRHRIEEAILTAVDNIITPGLI